MDTKVTPTQPGDLTTQAAPIEFEQAAPLHQRVLVADDDPYIRQLLELVLSDDGYEVISADNGHDLVRLAQEWAPQLILVDLMMPLMDGYEAIRQMRNDSRTAHIPMLILTARSRVGDVVIGFETGADDYIAKPFDISELLARVRGHLRRAAQRPVLNPLTGLPGSVMLSQELHRRLAHQPSVALLYADLDNFKAFNDTYGFSRGDRAIRLVASILQNVLATHGNHDDFIGHIGGDDFALLTTSDRVRSICRELIASFDREVRQLYPLEDLQRGYFTAVDRHGVLRRLKLLSISIGVVTSDRRTFADEEEFTRIAAEMKHYAKTQEGSSYAIDQRVSRQDTDVERRGQRQRGVLIASDDGSLRAVLCSALQDDGYLVREVADVEALRQQLAGEDEPAIVLADAHLGQPLWSFCAEQAAATHRPPLIMLAHEEEEIAQAHAAGIASYLRLPLPLAEVVACVEREITRSRDLAGETACVDEV